jgi:hypothetical protein
MLPYVSRARVVRRRTFLQKLWGYKLHVVIVLAVLGYVAFLNYQLNAEHRRTVAMEKQLQELTLQRLRDAVAAAETNGSPAPVQLSVAPQDKRPADVAATALRGRAGGRDTGGSMASADVQQDGAGSSDASAGLDANNNGRSSSDNAARQQDRDSDQSPAASEARSVSDAAPPR